MDWEVNGRAKWEEKLSVIVAGSHKSERGWARMIYTIHLICQAQTLSPARYRCRALRSPVPPPAVALSPIQRRVLTHLEVISVNSSASLYSILRVIVGPEIQCSTFNTSGRVNRCPSIVPHLLGDTLVFDAPFAPVNTLSQAQGSRLRQRVAALIGLAQAHFASLPVSSF